MGNSGYCMKGCDCETCGPVWHGKGIDDMEKKLSRFRGDTEPMSKERFFQEAVLALMPAWAEESLQQLMETAQEVTDVMFEEKA